ncbi:hypothetical protein TIFTF001_048834 [Ficus carica]|uniref:Uncharacterized protein n=1 Tax=Ficus carica TaxID=3494 RepID=A0AA87YSS7_FICCA|nr:hypothetical protein TIFTF001_048831 [Ficus carica]GMN21091.1 hypothetical protein TIFTF001_048832 [Ficus carica]GMN21098.1 hypothetical protein TIFTF001_048833 [Ficus carica]GMN21107.1 hypothetical protein TIFTF001_048834 [Ficus carica]
MPHLLPPHRDLILAVAATFTHLCRHHHLLARPWGHVFLAGVTISVMTFLPCRDLHLVGRHLVADRILQKFHCHRGKSRSPATSELCQRRDSKPTTPLQEMALLGAIRNLSSVNLDDFLLLL